LAWGFVLCIGADGHSAIEQAVSGKCSPAESTCPAKDDFPCDDHCGPCQDISTSLDFTYGRLHGDHDLSLPAPLPALVSVASPAFYRELTAKLSTQPPPRPYHALSALRTVVLLN
jgi:hypothetical protein